MATPVNEDEVNPLEETENDVLAKFKLDNLTAHLRAAWSRNTRAKVDVEEEMLTSRRQRDGKYDPRLQQVIADTGMSQLFVNLTNSKIRAAFAMILDILQAANEKPWTIKPTPIPSLDPDLEAELEDDIRDEVFQAAQVFSQATNQPVTPQEFESVADDRMEDLSERLLRGVKEKAKDMARNMEKEIDDQLVEGAWYRAIREVIDDILTYPAGILKGPIFRKKKRLTWGTDENGATTPITDDEIVVEFERVSPLDIYPEVDARSLEDGDLFELHHLTRKDINSLRGVKGYSSAAIDEIINMYGTNGWTEHTSIENERETAEGREGDNAIESYRIDALEYHGSVPGHMIKEWRELNDIQGESLEDTVDYEVHVWMVNNTIFKAVLNDDPLGRRPYQSASFEESAGSVWGRGIPYIIRDMQDTVNNAARAIANNLAIASGPQVEIDVSKITEGFEGKMTLEPWKVWKTDSQAIGTSRAINFYQPNVIVEPLMALWNKASQAADEILGIAAFQHGGVHTGNVGETASGLSMVMSSSARGIKSVIQQIDEYIITPVITKMYNFNMEFSDKEEIKGDIKIVAKGATSLVAKEVIQRRRQELLNFTNNDLDMRLLGEDGRRKLLAESIKSLDIDIDLDDTSLFQSEGNPPSQASPVLPEQLTPAGAPQGGEDQSAFPSPEGTSG